MNSFPSKEIVERLRKQYPHGTRVELVRMNDPYSKLKPGDKGSVDFIDDGGTLFCIWDCDSTLGVVYGEDAVVRIETQKEPMENDMMERAYFKRKPETVDELKAIYEANLNRGKGSSFVIEKIIELSETEFNDFAGNLLADRDYIKDNILLMDIDEGNVLHCILIKQKGAADGVLAFSDGFDYVRYGSYYEGP